MSLALEKVFACGRVPEWLRALDADPAAALHNLLLDRAALGHLAVADPVQLVLDWLRTLNDAAGLTSHPRRLDRPPLGPAAAPGRRPGRDADDPGLGAGDRPAGYRARSAHGWGSADGAGAC